MRYEQGLHIERNVSYWDTENSPKEFLRSVCPEGQEGVKWWYSEYDEHGVLVEQGQNIGEYQELIDILSAQALKKPAKVKRGFHGWEKA